MRRTDPTDLTDAEWAILAPHLPTPKTSGRPVTHNRREIVNAIRHVRRGGEAWRLLPHDFPAWQTVYHYFRLGRIQGVWERAHTALREHRRRQLNRSATPQCRHPR